jgi:uncharacterized protein (TIGR02996 family)
MDSQERALLEEIVEHPDDDMPRLIYADWLEDRGSPRAEFIRLQCELEQVSDDALQKQLRLQERKLLALYEKEWTEGVNREQVPYLRFRRGFVESIQTTVPYLRKAIVRRYQLWPVQTLDLSADSDDLPPLKSITWLRRIRTLKFGHKSLGVSKSLGVEGVKTLTECEDLASLRELYLTSCQIDSRSIGLLIHSPLLAGLRNLMLGGNSYGDEGAAALAESPRVSNLEQLGVAYSRVGDGGAAALTNSPNLANLKTLRFAGNIVESQTVDRMIARFGSGLLR